MTTLTNNSCSSTSRLLWADCLKLFAIFLVVWGHSVSNYVVGEEYHGFNLPIRKYLYSFHMPLFMMISGYFSYRIIDDGGNILKRFKSLIIPCITLFIIFMICNEHNQNMWYLKSLFLCYAITTLFVRFKRVTGGGNLLIYFLTFTIVFLTFPILTKLPIISAYKVDFMLPFFVFGIFLRRDLALLITREKFLLIWIILFAIGMVIWRSDYIWYNSRSQWFPLKQIYLSHTFLFDWKNLLYVLIRFCVGCTASLFFISLFYQLSELKGFQKLFAKIGKYGRYTLHIYILQTFLTEMNVIGIVLPTDNMFLFQYVYTPIISLVVTITSIILAQWLEKNDYINRYLFGKLA